MVQTITTSSETVFIGAFDIHKDNVEKLDAVTFQDCLASFNLDNIVTFEMYKFHHTIDLVLTDGNFSLVADVSQGHRLLDHCFIDTHLIIP